MLLLKISPIELIIINSLAGKNLVYGLKNNGVSIERGQISASTWKDAQIARANILKGKIKVAIHPNNK